ncbi:MAG: TlpA disulfide reductase family protein [Bacteroidota bacterium]
MRFCKFVLLSLFLLPLTQSAGAQTEGLADFSDLPFLVSDYAGLEHLFQQKNDTTYIINFWATWCAPCVKELPYFEQLGQQYKGQKVKVILISLDFKKQIRTRLVKFLDKKKIQSQVVVLSQPNANEWIGKVDPSWSGSIPATLVYNRQKREFYEQEFYDFAELESIVKSFIKK